MKFDNWTTAELSRAIELYGKGWQIKNIGLQINRTRYAVAQMMANKSTQESKTLRAAVFASRLTARQKEAIRKQEIKETTDNLRMTCYANGDTDAEAAAKCGIKYNTYSSWRKLRGLPSHSKETQAEQDIDLRRYDLKPIVHKKRKTLTESDLQYYKHNDNYLDPDSFIGVVNVIIPASNSPLLAIVSGLDDQDRVNARKLARDDERKNYTNRFEINNLAYVKACRI